ncbi:MAG: FimV/HubP family polar landmark protein [Woeseiaceae bacterium]|nr:FimV/HubP family polar landmark protein [Woeseiaceae bacterium]
MSRRLMRISLVLGLFLSSEVWAIGLGDINLDSALNEPLRAEISLLSATPEELASLDVALASSETFARYGIDRPFYLQQIEFNVVATSPNGPVVQIRSRAPITEPFLTFLVEANWPSGRLLREYTVLLDPPTYSPPAAQSPQQVEAPRRAAPTDSARIERQPQPQPAQQQRATPPPTQPRVTPPPSPPRGTTPRDTTPAPVADDTAYSTTAGGDVYVERGATLWGITSRMRPDSRLTMNQTMLAIFEANPQAFDGNINRLKAGASLRIPSADDIFQIDRTTALNEAKRQNEEWSGTTTDYSTDYTATEPSYTYEPEPVEEPAETAPSLVLVPPDEEPAGVDFGDDLETTEPLTREQEIENRIAELEAADVPDQPSLIEIRDSELATLRQELANIRGEIYEPPVDEIADETADEIFVDDSGAGADELFPDTDALPADDADAADEVADDVADQDAQPAETPAAPDEPGIVDQILGFLTSFWMWIVGAIVAVVGLLVWFARRGGGDDVDEMRPWESLDDDEMASATGVAEDLSSTESMQAPTPDEAIVVVEQDTGIRPLDDTIESETVDEPVDLGAPTGDTGEFDSLEDTFSSETAVNLDQTDPIAEADFHMAYGLYDQAADLINGALETDPSDKALMSKLCEIYFVWGNRDAFIDAASRLKGAVGDGDSAEWDKIVIMGQQIAADHALFAGAGVAGATKAVDLSFESDMDEAGALDMDFGGESADVGSDIVDLGATAETETVDDGVDFLFDDATAETGETAEMPAPVAEDDDTLEATAEVPIASEPTVETPTIEEQFAADNTSELPSLDESLGAAISDSGQDSEATAEINLDELDLDITGTNEALEDTGVNEAIDPNATGVQTAIDADASALVEGLDLDDLDSTGMRLAPDETGRLPMADVESETDTSIEVDVDLLEATGRTQILSDDLAVDTHSNIGDDEATMLASLDDDSPEEISADAETMLASLDDDDDDFDFAKTEALPPEAFSDGSDETREMPGVAGTDVDLDLDDLTAALAVSEAGDTVEQPRDDATVEQPRPSMGEETAEVPTMSLAPEEISDDLHEARTMTEVGTKLDLARAYVDMGDPAGARSILEEVLDEGDEGQRQQAQQLLDSLPS